MRTHREAVTHPQLHPTYEYRAAIGKDLSPAERGGAAAVLSLVGLVKRSHNIVHICMQQNIETSVPPLTHP